MRNIINDVRPIQQQAGQAGAPLTSTLVSEVARQTEMLWQQAGGNVRSWHWPDPATAPLCNVTAHNTETVFLLGDSTEEPRFEIPWHTPDGFSRTGATVFVATKARGNTGADVRIKTDDLLAAVAVTSTYWRSCGRFRIIPYSGLWWDDSQWWRAARVDMACGPATFIASRYHAYHFAMQTSAIETNVWSAATGFEIDFRLYGLRLWDLPADRAGLVTAGGE